MESEKTFLELANEIGTSKQNVYRCFKRLHQEARQEAIHRNGTVYLPESLQKLIKSILLPDKSNQELHQEATGSASRSTSDDATAYMVIKTLQEQLSIKDSQMMEKDKQIALLQESLAREQENVKLAQQLHGADKVQQALSTSDAAQRETAADGEAAAVEGMPGGAAIKEGKSGKGFRWPWKRNK